MSFPATWNLKWIDAGRCVGTQGSCTLTRQGVFCARKGGLVTGFVAFEPRDFNASFLVRLEKRLQGERASEFQYELIIPEFLRHRAESLLSSRVKDQLKLTFSSFVQLANVGSGFSLRSRMKVVNVDDSPVMLKFLKHLFEQTGYVDVVKQIMDSSSAASQIEAIKPDFVTMDIQMPGKTGVEVVRDLLDRQYFPVIMVSSLGLEDGSLVFEALNSGAFDYVQKPRLENRNEFIEDLSAKMLAAVAGKASRPVASKTRGPSRVAHSAPAYPPNLLWALGASTGGTQALTRVFTSMPTSIPPTLIVQHIPPLYSKAFAESLDQLVPFTVKEAEDGERVLKDHVYIAAGGLQMSVVDRQGELFISLTDAEPVNRFKPSVDYLFRSVATLRGRLVVAGIFTGMGRDGAEGLLELKNKGARTFAQDEASCAVFGMPRAAIELGAADKVCSLDAASETMLEMSVASFKSVKAA